MLRKNIMVGVGAKIEEIPAMLVQIASKFESEIHIQKSNKNVNAKSIMGVMTLGLLREDEIELSVTGNDEINALEAISTYLSK